MSLLRLRKGRMVLGCMIPEREGAELEESGSASGVSPSTTTNGTQPLLLPRSSADLLPSSVSSPDTWTSATTSVPHPTLSSLHPPHSNSTTATKDSIQSYLLQHVLLTKEQALLASELVRVRGGNWEKMSEVVWCLRPFIYGEGRLSFVSLPLFAPYLPLLPTPLTTALALKKYGSTHTLPYLLSLSLEYFAYSLRKSSTQSQSQTKNDDLSSVERDELQRRKWNFVWYVVRGPIWSRVTK